MTKPFDVAPPPSSWCPEPPEDEPALSWLAPRQDVLARAWMDADLGWLEFNRRVLHEARDPRTPLLERLKFLAIFAANLDEFCMKRLGRLRGHAHSDSEDDPLASLADGPTRLRRIRSAIQSLLVEQAACYEGLRAELRKHGVVLADWNELDEAQRAEVSDYFDRHVSPALTPLRFNPAQPLPFISNLSTNWAFILRGPASSGQVQVRVKSPNTLAQHIAVRANVPAAEWLFVSLEDVIRHNANKLFPGMEVIDAALFRVFRDAEVDLDDDKASDDVGTVRDAMVEALRERRFLPVVRVDFSAAASPEIRRSVIERFELGEDDVYEIDGLLDCTGLFQIASLDLPKLRDPPWVPLHPTWLAHDAGSIIATIGAGERLVHHPFESFDATVQRFIDEAATDPMTVAIKMTVYRVGDDTPFVRSLIRAAEAGKQVVCVIELKARFDEARNLHWAQQLEAAGVHVVYGVLGLKTHSKLALVVRKESAGLRCYAHIGTGNYHVRTARVYADVGLFTADPVVTADVVHLFHYFTGRSLPPAFDRLLVAPVNMREHFLALIRREIAHRKAGRPARIVAKTNQLEDVTIGRALVAASQAGVAVDLIVRGFCCLLPGVPGLTEQVRVRSIIGRFLEHARIFHFSNGEADPLDGDFYIGSADWMYRNLSRRVEAAVPVARPLRQRLWEILDINLRDCRQAWIMQRDGAYLQVVPASDTSDVAVLGSHVALMELARRSAGMPGSPDDLAGRRSGFPG